MNISELMSIEKLEQAIADGLVSKRKHPKHPIYILNYTAATQFAWDWNEVTLNCRGLVVDEDYNIVARSFPKFFSYEQLDGKLPEGNFIVEEKLDGSMLIVFRYNYEIITATRGSFESEQAVKAKEFLPNYFHIPENVTHIFEIVYKDNRIVVDYDYEGLVLLASFCRNQELEESELNIISILNGFRRPEVYSFNSLEEILSCNDENIEGFVLKYDSGERVKIKTEDYKRLHRLITGVSEKTVWEALKDNRFNELIENVPDEFYDWVHQVKDRLFLNYHNIGKQAMEDYANLQHLTDRKEFALKAVKTKYPQLLFKMKDGKDIDEMIWKLVRPEVTQVFKMVSEASN